jgi:hypothetical protein
VICVIASPFCRQQKGHEHLPMALFLSWRETYSARQQASKQYAAAAAAVALIAAAAGANVILPVNNMRPLENFLTGYHNNRQKSNYLARVLSR